MNHYKLKRNNRVAGIKKYLTGSIIAITLIIWGFSFPSNQQATKETGISARKFSAVAVDDKNVKWFATELGVVSFDGEKWKLHNQNGHLPSAGGNHLALASTGSGSEILIATSNGATVAPVPPDNQAGAKIFKSESSASMSDIVLRVAVGSNLLKWFGTDKGIAALSNDKWLTPAYDNMYPEGLFEAFPITSMGTNATGDTLYVGTDGVGVARVFKNDVDGISGASVYAMWGPIIIPSDTIHSVYIAKDRSKWFGTNLGLAKHTGDNTLDNWTVYTTAEGLVNDDVQAITADEKGNYWFGTKGGISVFNGSDWTSYTKANGLNSDNVLCLAVDKDGVVWIGTDNGVNCFKGGQFTSFK